MTLNLEEAARKTGRLEKVEGKTPIIVRDGMIEYYTALCQSINQDLAGIPKALKQFGLAEYDGEGLQRSILRIGFHAVENAVYDSTLLRLKKIGLFPGVQEELAAKNVEAIPNLNDVREEINNISYNVKTNLEGLDQKIDLESLVFSSGSLCVPREYIEAIPTRYTIPVTDEDLAIVEKLKSVGEIIKLLKTSGIQLNDEIRNPIRGGGPAMVSKGLISQFAEGFEFTEAELVSLVIGIPFTH